MRRIHIAIYLRDICAMPLQMQVDDRYLKLAYVGYLIARVRAICNRINWSIVRFEEFEYPRLSFPWSFRTPGASW